MCIHLSLLGNGSGKTLRGNEYKRNNRIIVGRVDFYAVPPLADEETPFQNT
jgi:hypothetical protein